MSIPADETPRYCCPVCDGLQTIENGLLTCPGCGGSGYVSRRWLQWRMVALRQARRTGRPWWRADCYQMLRDRYLDLLREHDARG